MCISLMRCSQTYYVSTSLNRCEHNWGVERGECRTPQKRPKTQLFGCRGSSERAGTAYNNLLDRGNDFVDTGKYLARWRAWAFGDPAMDIDQKTAAVRSFNRFYTKQIGVLHEGMLHSRFSLTQARVLFELAQRNDLTASVLQTDLDLDAGYLSRILRDLESERLIRRERSRSDGRMYMLSLTQKGREAFRMLDSRSQAQVRSMLLDLSKDDTARLLHAMRTITDILDHRPTDTSLILRPHQMSDIGWIIYRHAGLYSEEHGWDETFEALTAEILSEFIKNYDPKYERAWMAECNGEVVGCVFITKGSETIAKLRLLLVEPRVRGIGLGKRLVDECIRFSRRAGYEKITLYTNNVLTAARHIYKKAGFRMVREWPHHSYGHDLVGEDWELSLRR